ncbi:MAG: 6-phosphogluconolactonase [Chitinophagaceae bacterium]
MKNEFWADELMVEIYPDRAAMGKAAATAVINKLTELLNKQPMVNMIFAAAPSQNEFLQALAESKLDWKRVRAFHMDEYIGLDAAAPQGFGNFLKDRIFDKLPFAEIHYLDGNAADVAAACKAYSLLLKENPVDIVCMGIGENGHIAFNDPPVADFKDKQLVKIVELDQECRQQQVNDACFAAINLVPTHAITLTIPALMAARYVYCMVPGPTKANAVFNTINQQIIERYPSTILRTHKAANLYLDVQSAAQLKQVAEKI